MGTLDNLVSADVFIGSFMLGLTTRLSGRKTTVYGNMVLCSISLKDLVKLRKQLNPNTAPDKCSIVNQESLIYELLWEYASPEDKISWTSDLEKKNQ